MTYVIVYDVSATWEQYERSLKPLVEPTPDGLIFHAAGKTDEGYRTIDVWESEAACQQFRKERLAAVPDGGGFSTVQSRFRDFNPEHVIMARRAETS
jgi:hypothetical protein